MSDMQGGRGNRGNTVAMRAGAAAVGCVVLAWAWSCATKDTKEEEGARGQAAMAESAEDFWLQKLEMGRTREEMEVAAETLVAMESTKAFPRILDAWLSSPCGRRARDSCLLVGAAGKTGAAAAGQAGPDPTALAKLDSVVKTTILSCLTQDDALVLSLRAILRQTSGRSVPEVATALRHADPFARLFCLSLVVSGPDPRPYGDDLAARAQDSDPTVREAAAEAFKKIKGRSP